MILSVRSIVLLFGALFSSPVMADRESTCYSLAVALGDGEFREYRVSVLGGPVPEGLTTERIADQLFRYHDGLVRFPLVSYIGPDHIRVADALIGPAQGRPAYVEIGETNRTSIEKSVAQYMAAGLPIEGVTFWGGARQYGTGKNLGIDAADLLALLRYEAMNRAVKASGYSSGVKVQLVFEDLGRRFMGGDSPDMRRRVEHYQTDMQKLVATTTSCVHFTPESQIIAQNEVPPKVREILGLDPNKPMKGSDELFFQVASKAEDIMFAYLRASERPATRAPDDANDQAGFARVANLPEYQALERLGFKGGIPMAQRESVRKRTLLRLGNPTLTDAELDRHVAKYFAQGFARAIFNLRVGTSFAPGTNKPLDTLSYSFLPYPPGTPETMIVRRVELSAVEDTAGEKVVPCWGGCAVMYPDGSLQLRSQVPSPERTVTVRVESPTGARIDIPLHLGDALPR